MSQDSQSQVTKDVAEITECLINYAKKAMQQVETPEKSNTKKNNQAPPEQNSRKENKIINVGVTPLAAAATVNHLTNKAKTQQPQAGNNQTKNIFIAVKELLSEPVLKDKYDAFGKKYLELEKSNSSKYGSAELFKFYNKDEDLICLPYLFFKNIIVCDTQLVNIDYVIKQWRYNYFVLSKFYNLLFWILPVLNENKRGHINTTIYLSEKFLNIMKNDEDVVRKYITLYLIWLDSIGLKISESKTGKTEIVSNERLLYFCEYLTKAGDDVNIRSSFHIVMQSLVSFGFEIYATNLMTDLLFYKIDTGQLDENRKQWGHNVTKKISFIEMFGEENEKKIRNEISYMGPNYIDRIKRLLSPYPNNQYLTNGVVAQVIYNFYASTQQK
jgi:hypothetical protein